MHLIKTLISHDATGENLSVKRRNWRCRSYASLSLRHHAHWPLAKSLMHTAHLAGNTSGVSKSSSDWLDYTGFPWDVCVAFFNAPPGNKEAVTPSPLKKEESRRVYNCDDKRLSGSTKRWIFKICEIFKVRGIESLKYIREFVIVVTFPRLETWHWTKQTVIGCLTCRSNGLMGGPWPMKAAMDSTPSAVSLKVWLRETSHMPVTTWRK